LIGVMSLLVGLGLSALLTYAHAWFHDWFTTPLTLFFILGAMIILRSRMPRGISRPRKPFLLLAWLVAWTGALAYYLSYSNLAQLPIESAAAHRYDAAPECQTRSHQISVGDSVIAQTASGRPMAYWPPGSRGRVIETPENPDVIFTRIFEECYMILLTLLMILV
jgi:hypothetical protein